MHMALLNAVDLRLRAAEIVVTGEGNEAQALLAAARARPPLDRIVLHAGSVEALPPQHPARAKDRRRGLKPLPLSASAKPARCRSPIRPASIAPSMRCDILDAELHSTAICALLALPGRSKEIQ